MAQYSVQTQQISDILNNIKNSEMAVPLLQRPFVWDSTKVCELIDSLYKGYPVGFLVLWKNPDVKMKDGTKSGGRTILIDGQQRVTALQAAILGKKIKDAHYHKKSITISFDPQDKKFDVASNKTKTARWIYDISTIMSSNYSSYLFIPEYCRKNEITDPEKTNEIYLDIEKLRHLVDNGMGLIVLNTDLDIDSVTEIFIRINSKGVVLSQADFAMSKIFSNEIYGGNITGSTIDYFCHLQQVPGDYDEICESDPDFAPRTEMKEIRWVCDGMPLDYKTNYTDILRMAFIYKFKRGKLSDLVSLLSGRDFKARDYKESIAEESFKKLHDAVMKAVKHDKYSKFMEIIHSTGVVDAIMIYSRSSIDFCYALYLLLDEKGIPAGKIEKVIRKWYVLSILTGRYSGSPESTFDSDIKRFDKSEDPESIVNLAESADLSDAFWNVTLPEKMTTSSASRRYFTYFLMAQIHENGSGFLSENTKLTSMVEAIRGQVHHLFPRKYLERNGMTKSQYNQTANYVLLQKEINGAISDHPPCEYMSEVIKQCETKDVKLGDITETDTLKDNLRQHSIPEDFIHMDINNYDRFLEERRKLMAEKIRDYYQSL